MRQRICSQIQTKQDSGTRTAAHRDPGMAALPRAGACAGHCPGLFSQALLTSRSGLWGFISSTAWPLLTSMTWESPSQATCSIFPRMKVTTPVVPQRRLWKKTHFHFKAFSSLTQGQNTLKLQHRAIPREEQAVLSLQLQLLTNSPSEPTWLNTKVPHDSPGMGPACQELGTAGAAPAAARHSWVLVTPRAQPGRQLSVGMAAASFRGAGSWEKQELTFLWDVKLWTPVGHGELCADSTVPLWKGRTDLQGNALRVLLELFTNTTGWDVPALSGPAA